MSEIDDLLSQLKAEYTNQEEPQPITPPVVPPKTTPKPNDSSVDSLLAQLKGEIKDNQLPPIIVPKISSQIRFSPPVEPNLFQELRSEYQEQEQIDAERQQLENEQKQRLAKQKEQKKQKALQEKAQIWLKQLNPKSDEGKWFEEFSYSYDSKIEAAMHYLEAMRESGQNL